MNHHGEKHYNLKFMVTTVSSTRTMENDRSGKSMMNMLLNDYKSVDYGIVHDDEIEILSLLFKNINDHDVFIFIGGTGVSRRDITSASIRKIADREVKGFGELFRIKSGGIFPYISDASLFIYRKRIIFTLPGSENAQPLAYEIIKNIIDHLYYEINKE
ncbi:MogA/MoaB family molybdenum cofactor biosynthesis protein [Picrophilus oshimae]|uniref:Molybdenum cofactor biosynthesis protein B n=1 Tax=Picrophilus torridus (strain ATCC 700027 / DSM 9790 / JCM 10055 / NBRC 100828 / KAW 2/3) TaxID=1122961 RepID=Q6L057_PICTO|nr:MogA/MoaB family molybdenum cofactor biosynthesis protein [Picrophilus oshimae]AAT43645.1 molybdenum cofactor biosynthesis protein B [Picrophilus oshimae DSM 9789]